VLRRLINYRCLSIFAVSFFGEFVGLVACTDDADCNHFKNATCSGGFCNCGNLYGVCETERDALGSKCVNSGDCRSSNLQCSLKGECVCRGGLVASKDGTTCLQTVAKIGDSCDETTQCASRFPSAVCLDNRCACPNKSDGCDKIADLGEECVRDEECALTNSSSCIDFKCSCVETHVAINLRCLRVAHDIGDGCEDDIQCTSVFGSGSVCARGGCQCKRFFRYDAEGRTCIGERFLNKTCDSDDACYQPGQPNNLVCFDGMCKCKLDHLEEGGHCKEIATKEAPSASNRSRGDQFFVLSIFVLSILCM
jgi:hypothetical protein